MNKTRILAPIYGTAAGFNAFVSLDGLMELTSTRSALFQKGLEKATSPLSEEAYQNIMKSVEDLVQGDYSMVFVNALVAGFCSGMTIYHACKKD